MYGLLDFWWPQFGKLVFKYAHSKSNVTWLLFSKEAYLFKEKHASAMQFYLNHFTQRFNGAISSALLENTTDILQSCSLSPYLLLTSLQQATKITGSPNLKTYINTYITKEFGLDRFYNIVMAEQVKIQNLRSLYSHKVGEYDGLLFAMSSSLYFMMSFYNTIEKKLHNINLDNANTNLFDLGDDRFVPWIEFLSKFMCGLMFDYALVTFSKNPSMHKIGVQYYLLCAASELNIEAIGRIATNLYDSLCSLIIIFDKTCKKTYKLTNADYWEINNHINIVRRTWQSIPKVSEFFSVQYKELKNIIMPEFTAWYDSTKPKISKPIAIQKTDKHKIEKKDSSDDEFNIPFANKESYSKNVNMRVEPIESLNRDEALHINFHAMNDHKPTIIINDYTNTITLPRELSPKIGTMYFPFSLDKGDCLFDDDFNMPFVNKKDYSFPLKNTNMRVESVETLDRGEALHLNDRKKHDNNGATIIINNDINTMELSHILISEEAQKYFSLPQCQSDSLVKRDSHSIESGMSTDAGNSSQDKVKLWPERAWTTVPPYVDIGFECQTKGSPNSLPNLTGHNHLSLR